MDGRLELTRSMNMASYPSERTDNLQQCIVLFILQFVTDYFRVEYICIYNVLLFPSFLIIVKKNESLMCIVYITGIIIVGTLGDMFVLCPVNDCIMDIQWSVS
jgi:hypothetical protein